MTLEHQDAVRVMLAAMVTRTEDERDQARTERDRALAHNAALVQQIKAAGMVPVADKENGQCGSS